MRHITPIIAGLALAAGPLSLGAQRATLPAGKDTVCDACKNFYAFANKAWLAAAKIPADQPAWGPIFSVSDHTLIVLQTILREAAVDRLAPLGSRTQKLGAFYTSCIDSSGAEAYGLTPVRAVLARIDSIRDVATLQREIARVQQRGTGAVFSLGASIDPMNSKKVIATLNQGGLGLPDRDYYLRTDTTMAGLRLAYVHFVARLFELSGEYEAAARADADSVLALETALARISMSRQDLRDPKLSYHKMSAAQFRALAPGLEWDTYVTERHMPPIDSFVVRQPEFLTAVGGMMSSVPLSTWRAYLRARLLVDASQYLSQPFVDASFEFRRLFTGQRAQPPRGLLCVAQANGAIGEMLGQAYVERAFPPAAKARVEAMVANLRAALGERIKNLSWMSAPTKQEALRKLASFKVKIGYPDKWQDYTALTLDRGPFIDNMMRVRQYIGDKRMATIGHAPDADEWSNPPQTVDAFAGSLNEIVFPAGLLQAPFFDMNADDAANYGAIGTTIGHEMTHHFDDRGRQFDAEGNLRDWWSAPDAAAYNERAAKVVQQFSAYTFLNTPVDGRLTLSENIADLGGLKVSYDAFQVAMRGKPRTTVEGFTPEQRFFIANARFWAVLYRPEYERERLRTDPHAPWPLRVDGPFSNLPEFAAAFKCKEGDPMVRSAALRVTIW